uniref:Mur ligase domain-containing protein n=3 Tax=Beutenbergiaceae TaxID=125316 RepID=UPI0028ADEE4B
MTAPLAQLRPTRVPAVPLAELAAAYALTVASEGVPASPDGTADGLDGVPDDALHGTVGSSRGTLEAVLDGVLVTGVTVASDEARAGDLFVAVPGLRAHGARFAAAAVAAGAVAVVTDE